MAFSTYAQGTNYVAGQASTVLTKLQANEVGLETSLAATEARLEDLTAQFKGSGVLTDTTATLGSGNITIPTGLKAVKGAIITTTSPLVIAYTPSAVSYIFLTQAGGLRVRSTNTELTDDILIKSVDATSTPAVNQTPTGRQNFKTCQMEISLFGGDTEFTSAAVMARFGAMYKPSKYPILTAAYLETAAYRTLGTTGKTDFYKNVGGSQTSLGSITPTQTAEGYLCIERSADILATLGTTDCVVYIGRTADASNKIKLHNAKLILEYIN